MILKGCCSTSDVICIGELYGLVGRRDEISLLPQQNQRIQINEQEAHDFGRLVLRENKRVLHSSHIRAEILAKRLLGSENQRLLPQKDFRFHVCTSQRGRERNWDNRAMQEWFLSEALPSERPSSAWWLPWRIDAVRKCSERGQADYWKRTGVTCDCREAIIELCGSFPPKNSLASHQPFAKRQST